MTKFLFPLEIFAILPYRKKIRFSLYAFVYETKLQVQFSSRFAKYDNRLYE